MSMELRTIIELIQVLTAYTVCVCLAPYIVFHHYLYKKCFSEKFIICVLIGNFYIINIVFLIFLLHIPGRLALYFFTIIPSIIVWMRVNHPNVKGFFSLIYTAFSRLFLGEAQIKTILSILFYQPKKLFRTCRRAAFSHILSHLLEWVMLLGLLGFNAYHYGYQTVTKYVYGTSDIIVHHTWINEMDYGTIFWHGIYPFGFHNIVWFLHKFFGFETLSILRVFGIIETLFIYSMIYLILRQICRSRYIPILGVFLFTLPNLFNFQATMRYQWALPQEFGMLFLYPCGYFFIQFFERKKEELQTKKELAQKNKLYIWLTQYHIMPSTRSLTFFAMSFSLTLAAHFYITIIAVILCVAIAIAYFPIVFHPKYFWSIALAGTLSLIVAVAPMGIAYAQGTDLEGSLEWALSIIFPATASDDEVKDTDEAKANKDTLKREETAKENPQILSASIRSCSPISGSKTENGILLEKLKPGVDNTVSVLKMCYKKLVSFNSLISRFLRNTYNNDNWIIWFIRAIEFFMVFSVLMIVLFRKCYYRNLLSISLYMLFMIIMTCAPALNLPSVMDVARSRIFLAYATPLMLACFADVIFVILGRPLRYHWSTEILPIGLTVALTVLTITNHLVKPLNIIYSLQATGEMQCNYEIMENYPENKWTIVTTTNSAQILREKGRHMEVCTFLKKMQNYTQQSQVTIPTKYVFIYIEKTPLEYGSFDSVTQELKNCGYISEEAAAKSAVYSGSSVYESKNRYILESKLFYWAKAFEQQYPEEFQVYYEDESFLCYRIIQNEYRLYNFAIDYGFNK